MAIVRGPKSPGYPTMSLVEAIAKIDMIYRKERAHPVHRDVLVKHIGYGTWNGGSSVAVATLRRYGLLEQGGNKEQYRVSDEAIAILLNYPERVKIIQKLAFMPSVFSELHQYYGDALPSDQNIKMYLIKKGYNDKFVNGIIRSYRDTIEFVNAETAGSNTESLDEEQEVPTVQTQMPRQVNPDSSNSLRSDLAPSPPLEKGVNESEYVLTFKPAQNIRVKVEITSIGTGTLTQDAFQKTIKHLQLDMDGYPVKVSVDEGTDHHEHDSEA